jgi:1,5-anhydro-D-fructose reductase (1,5-anhydro-D-mannitol-forming)
MHGTKASLAYESTDNLLRHQNAGAETWQTLAVPPDGADAFSQWVTHIRAHTRADDNLTRAVELTRLVTAANTAAATGTAVHYPIGVA